MWNEPAASTDGSAPAETPEQPEPAYESKQDEPSAGPRAADPRTPEAPAPAADEEDAGRVAAGGLRGLLAHPDPRAVRRRQGGALRAAAAVQDAHVHLRRQVPLRPGPLLLRARRVGTRPPQARWWLPEYKTKPCRYAASECPFMRTAAASTRTRSAGRRPIARDSLDTTDAGRGAPTTRSAAAGEDEDKKYKTRMCRYGAGIARSAQVLRAQRRSLPRGKINSSRRRRGKPGRSARRRAPAARARRAAGRAADVVSRPPAPRPPRQRASRRSSSRPRRAGRCASRARSRPRPRCPAGADGAATAAAPVAAAAGRLHAARDGDAAARGAATAGVRPAAAVRRGAGAAAWVRRAPAFTSRLRRAAATVRVGPAPPAAAGS